jgi:hypothetical protein
VWRLTARLADMSDPCRRPIQTDRHGHPPIGVSSCPVGKIGGVVSACSALPLLRIPKLTRQCKRATRKPPPVCLRCDQNLRSKLSAKLERLLLPTRSMTRGKGSNERHSKRDACITDSKPHNKTNQISRTLS